MRRGRSRRHSPDLQQQPKTKNEGAPAADQRSSAPPVTGAIIQIPDAVLEEYRTNQKQNGRDNKINRWIAIAAVLGAWIYAGIAAFQFCTMRRQTEVLTGEEVAQISITDLQPKNFGTDGAEVIVTIHNSGQMPAIDFWYRQESWEIDPFGLQLQKLGVLSQIPNLPTNGSDIGMNAFKMASNAGLKMLQGAFDPNLDIDSQHPQMASEADIKQLTDAEKKLGKLPPQFAPYQAYRSVFVGEIGPVSSWPLRIKVRRDFGNSTATQNVPENVKNPPAPQPQASYLTIRYGYGDRIIGPDYCFRYMPEDNAFTYCQKAAD